MNNFAESIDFASLMEPVALRLLGEPNPRLSKPPSDVRFGTHGSMSIDFAAGRFFDHEANAGGGVVDLIQHKLNCDHAGAVSYLRREGFLPNGSAPRSAPPKPKLVVSDVPKKVVAEYDYTDETGGLLFQALRYEPKTFRQRRPDGHGDWIWSIKDTRRVLYRLPELISAIAAGRTIFLVEGEKDADNLRALGLAATTNPMGAKKWEPEYSEFLRGANVVVCGDVNAPGQAHVEQVTKALHGIAKRLRVLDLAKVWPECPEDGDISKWIEAGGTVEKLKEAVKPLPDWQPPKTKQEPSWRDHCYTAEELRTRTFPPVAFCVPDLIPEGLTLIAGKPKIGKSWMALDICIAVAFGRFCLGDRKPMQGDTLYAAMEDNPRRLQRRIDKVLPTFSGAWPAQLTLANSWQRLDKGGVDDIAAWIDQANNPRLIVLDTLAGVKPVRTQQGYTEDYESLTALHQLANQRGVSIIVLHHTRKMEADDPVDTVSGTLGLAGCADTILVLSRTSQGTTLYVRGRDVEEAEHAMLFDKHNCRWTILGDAAEVHRSNERGKILEALTDATVLMSPQEVAAITAMPTNNVSQLLFKMAEKGEVIKEARGRYRHPDRTDLTPNKNDKKIREDEK